MTAPGPGSGKLATCMSNMYHDQLNGIKSGYAKFETFPVWNLPLHHPVNLAYEAATADLDDVNMIDPIPPPNLWRNNGQLQPGYRNLPCLEADVGTHPRRISLRFPNRYGCEHGRLCHRGQRCSD